MNVCEPSYSARCAELRDQIFVQFPRGWRGSRSANLLHSQRPGRFVVLRCDRQGRAMPRRRWGAILRLRRDTQRLGSLSLAQMQGPFLKVMRLYEDRLFLKPMHFALPDFMEAFRIMFLVRKVQSLFIKGFVLMFSTSGPRRVLIGQTGPQGREGP